MRPAINIVDMTEVEARAKHEQLKQLHGIARSLLLEIRDRKGYLPLGYYTFEAYAEAEWGYSQSYVYRLAKAEEIQQSLNSPIGEKDIPETQLRPLAKVPPADRQSVFDEAKRIAEEQGKEITAKAVQEAVADYKKQLETAQGKLDIFENNIGSLIEQRKEQSQAEIDEQLRKTIAEKEEEFGNRFEDLERELHSDYTAKINSQKDEISRLKNELVKVQQKSHADKDWDNAEQVKNYLIKEVAEKQAELNELEEKCENAAYQKRVNDAHQSIAEQLVSFVAEVATKLNFFQYENGSEDYQPPQLTAETKFKLGYAANALIDAEKALRFIATGKVEDF